MELAPLLLSDFKYKLNDKCDLVKHAHRLFDLRSQFLHVKDLWHYAEVQYGSNGEVLGVDYLVKNHPDPYRNAGKLELGKLMSVGEVESLAKSFVYRFRTMPNAMRRKNFKLTVAHCATMTEHA